MRVVIAGSSGFIGTSLVAALRQGGHEVVRLVRRTAEAPDERTWDPDAGQLDDAALAGADAVVNLCGAGLADRWWSTERKQLLVSSRVRPTALLAEKVARLGIPALLNGSAVGFYGDTGARVVAESSPPGAGFLAGLCRQWEEATAPAAEAGARVVLLRTGIVVAPSGGLVGRLRPLFSFLLGARIGDGSQYMSWISLDDAVGAMRFAAENAELDGPVNLTAPTPVTNAEFTREFGRALGRPAPWAVPGFVLRRMLGQVADEALLAGQRAVPEVLDKHGYSFAHPTLEAALSTVAA